MIIRDATEGDAALIASIWNQMISDTAFTFTTHLKTPEEIAAAISARQGAGDAFLVGETGGSVAGFALFGPFRSGPGYASVREHTVILSPQARGQGFGRALLGKLENRARAAGIHALIGGISGENPAAIAFHIALGFAETGRLPEVGCKFGRRLDLVFLQKNL